MAEEQTAQVTEQVQVESPAQAELPIESKPASEVKPDAVTEGAEKPAQATEGAKPSETGSEQKTEPTKAAEAIKYELKQPDGSLLEGRIEKIEALAKAQGLSNEQAQAILDSEAAAVQEFVAQTKPQGSLWNSQLDAWEAEVMQSKEIGGNQQKLAETKRLSLEALDKSGFFPEGFKEFLYETGLGSHPKMVTALVRIRKAMANDKAVHGQHGSTQPRSIEDRLYNNGEQK